MLRQTKQWCLDDRRTTKLACTHQRCDVFSGQAPGQCWSATFAPVQSAKVRLLVVSTRNNVTPSIFEFAVYDDAEAAPPASS